jgi:hypothetical protein
MLLRCASLFFALGQLFRFAVTTAGLAGKRVLRIPVPAAANARTGLRLKVLGQVLVRLPSTLRQRRTIGRFVKVSRSAVAKRWLGVDPLDDEREG